jgi:hypothetical protein
MAFVTNKSGKSVSVDILKIDNTGTYTYMGDADPGTATSADAWSISRVTNASGDILFAAGGEFSQIWDNRASLSYA